MCHGSAGVLQQASEAKGLIALYLVCGSLGSLVYVVGQAIQNCRWIAPPPHNPLSATKFGAGLLQRFSVAKG